MYISLEWLNDFVKIPNKIKPEFIKEELTKHTVEVEKIINQADQFNKVVVGKVLEVEKHPNADRLRIAKVDVKSEKLTIVCGAPNLEAGQLVPVSLIGAQLPNGLEIKESVIRGEKSSGMICAEDELGLGEDHDGILVLDKKAKVGQNFSQYLDNSDLVLEIDNKSLSNRPDLLNHYGIARELSAIFSLDLKNYSNFIEDGEKFLDNNKNKLDIKIEAKDLCLRYSAIKIDNIKIEESPDWLKKRLIAVNQKPINNIVDLSNYIMLDYGQPLHTFDADKVEKIVVRRARKNEIMETLDDQEKKLTEDDLVISDGNNVLALAGVKGAKNSGINKKTSSLIIESANFLASNVRKTSQRLALRTEASLRFEKSLDPQMTETALKRFLVLLKGICPEMTVASAIFDYNNSEEKTVSIKFNLKWLKLKIGQEIPRDFVISSLEKLGFSITENKEDLNSLEVVVPSWRKRDVNIKEDLAEEVLRLYGYDKIKSQLPNLTISLPEENKEKLLIRKIKEILIWGQGLNEVYNYSFVSKKDLEKLKIDYSHHLRLLNPSSDTRTLLRQSLVPGLISNIVSNQFKDSELGFMEIANVFFDLPGKFPKEDQGLEVLPYQEKHLGIILAADINLFDRLKGIIKKLLKTLINSKLLVDFSIIEFKPLWSDQNLIASIRIFNKEIGTIAKINKEVSASFNLKKEVVVSEISLKALFDIILSLPTNSFEEIPKYPVLTRDISFVVKSEVLYNKLRDEIINFNPLITKVELFDVYQGKGLESDQKSLAFHLSYQSLEKTLEAEEVNKIHQELIDYLAKKFSAKLRDF